MDKDDFNKDGEHAKLIKPFLKLAKNCKQKQMLTTAQMMLSV